LNSNTFNSSDHGGAVIAFASALQANSAIELHDAGSGRWASLFTFVRAVGARS
jgi:hypothetical protein